MDALAPAWLVARFLLLLAGLLVPGAAIARALRVPVTVATSFAGSAVTIYATVLALQLAGLRITLGSIACGLIVVGVAALAFGAGRAGFSPPSSRHQATTVNQNDHRDQGGLKPALILGLCALFWIAVIWRAVHEPLAGPDVEFRWSFLAEQMLRLGTLDFYPPQTAHDFSEYFWVESIPPGTASLHAWAYACAGSVNANWTVAAVVLQIWTLHDLLWRTASLIGGREAARWTILAAAACPLLTWSMLLGQETGLTAIALAGIAFAFVQWQPTTAWQSAMLAGLFATLGASAREYGVVFPALAAVVLLIRRANRWAWLGFGVTAAVGLVWPAYVWIRTGNPLYSLNVAGLFPVNDGFVRWVNDEAETFGAVLKTAAGWRSTARYFVLFGALAALGWPVLLVAAIRRRGPALLALAAVLLIVALWLASVRYTNGGLFYSMRVLSPALAMGALAVGCWIGALQTQRPRIGRALGVAVVLTFVATLPETLALPANAWRTPWHQWPAFAARAALPVGEKDATVRIILNDLGHAASSPVVIADAPGFQRRFLPTGIKAVPLWSPQASWLFDRSMRPSEAVQAWRHSGIRHVILTKWPANLNFFNTRSRWAEPPFHTQLIGETETTAVFRIMAAE